MATRALTQQRDKSRRSQPRVTNPLSNVPPSPPPLPPITTPLSFLTGVKKTPYSIQRDYKVLDREKRVTTILGDDQFRAQLETILQAQMNGSAHPKKTNLKKLQETSSHSPSRITTMTGVLGSATEAIIPIDDLRGVSASKYTVAEKQTRCRLAAMYRLIDMFGWSQLIYNSITARSPGDGDTILVNPFGLLYSEVTASRLVTVDSHGAVIDPGSTQLGINEAGFALHACVHSVRRDVKCVVHVHTTAGVAVSSMICGLLTVSEEAVSKTDIVKIVDGLLITKLGDISYHDGLHLSIDEQEQQIAQDLGPTNKVLILRNHGLVALGGSIEEAFHITRKLVKACEIQVTLLTVGLDNITQSKGVWSKSRPCQGGVDVESTFTIFDSISRKWGPGELEFEALMRMLDNKGYNSGYRYKGLSLLEPDSGKSGAWSSVQNNPNKDWNFLDHKKINRTEPVINRRNKHKQSKGTREKSKQDISGVSAETPNRGQAVTDCGLSPLKRAELTAGQVAQSTGEAVQILAKDVSLLQSDSRTPTGHTPDLMQLSALEMAQHTAERVARSTGEALKTLTHDYAAKTLQNSQFPDHVRNGDLETSSEPFLLTGGGFRVLPARLADQYQSLRELNTAEETATSQQNGCVGLLSFHQSLGSLDMEGLSPLEMVTHTAEKVAGSTGIAVIKLSDSITTTPNITQH